MALLAAVAATWLRTAPVVTIGAERMGSDPTTVPETWRCSVFGGHYTIDFDLSRQ